MFGVVLWRDEQAQNAVIWCEDHGDLAFYRSQDGIGEIDMDAGDWVQFDMTLAQNQRLAHNPRLVSEGVYPDLADALGSVQTPDLAIETVDDGLRPERQTEPCERKSAQIIPLFGGTASRETQTAQSQSA